MKNDNQQLVVNLVTTSQEFTTLIKDLIDTSLKEHFNKQPSLQTTDQREKLYTVQEVAVFFAVSTTTIHAWKNQGILSFVKINSRIRFRHSDLIALNTKRNK